MKISELNPNILEAMVKAAKDISVAKIRVLDGNHKADHNFFDAEFRRICESIEREILRDAS